MTTPRETVLLGGSDYCDECQMKMPFQVLSSAAGYYIGTRCNCGPNSRESEYYRSYNDADAALAAWNGAEWPEWGRH